MIIKRKQKDFMTNFSDINIGTFFTLDDEDNIYLKITNREKETNAFDCTEEIVCVFTKDCAVIPFNCKIVEI